MTDFTELHNDLRAVARDLLSESPDWHDIVQAGWPGLEVGSDLDGAGATFAEVAVVLTEIGRTAAVTPYPAAALAIGALADAELLREVVAGTTVPILVLAGDGHGEFQLDNGLLRGSAEFVLDAPGADVFLVPVHGSLAAVDPQHVTITEQPVLDTTRRFGRVDAEGVRPTAIWPCQADLRSRAAIAIACDSLGLAKAMLDATVAHVTTREQFGHPVGSFQAVQHACADMLVQVTVAGKLVEAAARTPNAVTAAMAKSFTCGMAVDVVGKAMQLHGGMGYTWDSGIHTYLKRATLNRSLFGSPAQHRRLLVRRYSAGWPPVPEGHPS